MDASHFGLPELGFSIINLTRTKNDLNDLITFRINIKDEDDVDTYVKGFLAHKMCFNVKNTFPHSVKYAFRKEFCCMYGDKRNKGVKKIFTGCELKMDIKIRLVTKFTLRKDRTLSTHPCVVKITGTHNHPLDSSAALSKLRVLPEVKEEFFKYFDIGMSTAQAVKFHQEQLKSNPSDLADRSKNPTPRCVQYLRNVWLNQKDGESGESWMNRAISNGGESKPVVKTLNDCEPGWHFLEVLLNENDDKVTEVENEEKGTLNQHGIAIAKGQVNERTLYNNTRTLDLHLEDKNVLNNSQINENNVLSDPKVNENNFLTHSQMNENNFLRNPQVYENNVLTNPLINENNVLTNPLIIENDFLSDPQINENFLSNGQENEKNFMSNPEISENGVLTDPIADSKSKAKDIVSTSDGQSYSDYVKDFCEAISQAVNIYKDENTEEAFKKFNLEIKSIKSSNQLNNLISNMGTSITKRRGKVRDKIPLQPSFIARQQVGLPHVFFTKGNSKKRKKSAEVI